MPVATQRTLSRTELMRRDIHVIRKRALVAIISSVLSALCLTCSVCFGQTWSTLPVDMLVDMNTSTPGTALTSSILTSGTIVGTSCIPGKSCTWGTPQGNGAFTVGANQGLCSNLGAVAVNGGSTYASQTLNYNNVAHNDADHNTNEELTFSGTPATATNVSASVCITLGPPVQRNGTDWDMLLLWNNLGNFVALQFNPECGNTTAAIYGVRLEAENYPYHSTCIPLTAQGTYFFSVNYNMSAGTGTLYAYTAEGVPIPCLAGSGTAGESACNADGSAQVAAVKAGTFYQVWMGNNELGTNSGTTTYFQNLMLNWTQGPNPLFWTNESSGTSYQLTTAASPSNGGTVSPASGNSYVAGTVVSLSATPNSGYAFSGWTGPVANPSSASTTVTMNAPANVTANFQSNAVQVTVGASPAGPSFTVDGTTYTSPQTLTWTIGTSHTLATTSPQTPIAGTEYAFSGWSDGGAIAHTVTAPSTTTTYTASFTTSYLLTPGVSPSGGGTVSPASSGYYAAGTVVNLSATANSGYAFSGWTGPVANPSSASTTVTMNAPANVTANFQSNAVQVTVGASPAGPSFTVDGTTYTSPQTLTWTIGTSHTLATTSPQTPIAGTEYAFSGWSDGGTIAHSVTAPSTTTTYTASFTTSYLLTPGVSPSGGGTVSPASSGYYGAGTVVNLSATANSGYAFSGWTGPVANPSSASTTVTMNAPANVTANFQSTTALAVDLLVTMDTSSPGTALTSSILTAGTVSDSCTLGTNCTWSQPSSAFAVGANQGACTNLGDVSLNNGGPTYAAGSLSYNSIGHNDADPETSETLSFKGSSAQNISAAACIALGPPAQPNGSDWDILTVSDTGGHYAALQLNPSCPVFGEYGVRIESNASGVSHSSCIPITPQTTYFFSLNYNMVSGVESLYVYTTDGNLFGNTTVAGITGGHLGSVYIGNAQVGSNSGTTTYFQNLMLNWTQGTNPLFWANESTDASYPLTTAASPSNGGTVSLASGNSYAAGTVVNLSATPSSGYAFSGWTGPVANPSSASTTVTVNVPVSVTANFQASSSGTPTFVASASGTNQSGAEYLSIASSSALDVSIGDDLWVACRSKLGRSSSVTDTAGNSFTQVHAPVEVTGGGAYLAIYHTHAAWSQSSDTITCNFSANDQYISVVAMQFRNLIGAVDGETSPHACVGACSSATYTSNAYSTTGANEVLLTCATYAHNTLTWNAGAMGGTKGILATTSNGGTGGDTACEYQIINTTQSKITNSIGISAAGKYYWAITADSLE